MLVAAPPSESQESGRAGRAEGAETDLAAWLHVAEDGSVTVFTGKVEVGQNMRTSLSQAVAEELRAPLESIRLVMADTDLTPFDMGTFGSRSTPDMAPQLRKAAAAARELLKELAAREWSVEPAALDGRRRQDHPRPHEADDRLRRAHQGPEARAHDRGRAPRDSGGALDRGRPLGGQGGRPRDRDRPPPLHERPRPQDVRAVRAALRQGPAAARDRRDARLDRAREHESLAGAVGRDRRRLRRRRAQELVGGRAGARVAAPKWNLTPQPEGRELFDRLRQAPEAGAREGGRGGGPHVVGSVAEARAKADAPPGGELHRRLHRPRPARAARGGGRVEGRHSSPSGPARSARSACAASWPRPSASRERQGARDRARHRLRLRRQAHRRGRDRGGAARANRGQAGQAGLDARGGVHLGLLPPGRRDRREERRRRGRHVCSPGSSTTTTPAARRSGRSTKPRTSRSSSTRAARRCARARTAPSPRPPTTSPASRTWTSSRRRSASTRSSSACGT